MKIIQSFWSQNLTDITKERFGWVYPEFNLLSWILSSNQLSLFYDVELYTDKTGYEILIEKLQLPYKKVHIVADELNHYHKDLWAIPKIQAYSLQDEPFLHVDGDVFIWKAFPEALLKKSLITQNLENTTLYYKNMWNEIRPKLAYIPSQLDNYANGTANSACNMGITGGTDTSFFKEYTTLAFEFVNKNREVWHEINGFNFNIFFEQLLFHEQATIRNKEVSYLIDGITEDNNYVGFGDFDRVPHQKTYLHLLGVYKRNMRVCKMLEDYVMIKYPDFFCRLALILPEVYPYALPGEIFSKGNIEPLIIDFYAAVKNGRTLIINEAFLLGRDMAALENCNVFDAHAEHDNVNFTIYRLPCNEIYKVPEQARPILKILELNKVHSFMEIDEMDEIILKELSEPVLYLDFINVMNGYLEDEATDALDDFRKLLHDRLRYFIVSRVLVIE